MQDLLSRESLACHERALSELYGQLDEMGCCPGDHSIIGKAISVLRTLNAHECLLGDTLAELGLECDAKDAHLHAVEHLRELVAERNELKRARDAFLELTLKMNNAGYANAESRS